MPEEKASGMLISPTGSPVEPLGDYEYTELATCLRILEGTSESKRDVAFIQALRHFLCLYRDSSKTLAEIPPDSTKGVLAGIISWWLADHESSVDYWDEDFYGILYRGGGGIGTLETLKEDEQNILADTLVAIRECGWFKSWLWSQVAVIAKGKMPDDRHPSPHKVAGSLVLEIAEWQDREDSAKAFAEMRPDLLFPAPPAEPEAAPEPSPASKPRRAPATRKRGRKQAA